MIMGYNLFGSPDKRCYQHRIFHTSYDEISVSNMIIDDLFVDEDVIKIPFTPDADIEWTYKTIMRAQFKGNLEAGSVEANNFEIERIRFQRRQKDGVEWQDIGDLNYSPDKKLLYEVIDKNIRNDFEYEYALLPLTNSVSGRRIISNPITADFEAIFLSDRENNYSLLYNTTSDSINHNISSVAIELLNSQYPIVIDGNLDYKSGGITALFVSAETENKKDGTVSINAEVLGRQKLMSFLKNKKPKVLRQPNGEIMLIRVVDKPQEIPEGKIEGLASVQFNFVEVGGMDFDTLRANDILLQIEEEF